MAGLCPDEGVRTMPLGGFFGACAPREGVRALPLNMCYLLFLSEKAKQQDEKSKSTRRCVNRNASKYGKGYNDDISKWIPTFNISIFH